MELPIFDRSNIGFRSLDYKTIRSLVFKCHRVGTLGFANHEKILGSLKILLRRRGLSKIFILGYFTLTGVSWSALAGSSPIEQSFVESFVNLGLQ
jgi:hypothetical protein